MNLTLVDGATAPVENNDLNDSVVVDAAPELLKKICAGDADTKLIEPVVGDATVILVLAVAPVVVAAIVSVPEHSVPSDLTEL